MKNKHRTHVLEILFSGVLCCLILICANVFTKEKNHIHSYDEWVCISNPTCTQEGLRERYCSCGDRQESKISPLGHEFVPVEGKSADCENGGYGAYFQCSRCDVNTLEEIEALGHDFGEWTQVKPATCISYGEEIRICSRDEQHFETRRTEKTAHSMTEWTEVTVATCMSGGLNRRECTVCHFEETQTVEALGHQFGDWNEVNKVTCTTDGLSRRVCSVCHMQETRTIKCEGHKFGNWEKVNEATCTADGLNRRECTLCHTEETQTVGALGHDFGEWKQVTELSCLCDGVAQRICSRDQTHIETRTTPKLEHTLTGWLTERSATCTENGTEYIKCTVCQSRIDTRTVKATGHNFGKWEQVSAPSCTATGEERRICSNNETHIEMRTLGKLPHDATDWIIDTEPICGKAGERHKECEICGSVLERETVSALEHNFKMFYNDSNHYLECSLCKTVKDSQPHIWGDNDCTVCEYDAGGIKGLGWELTADGGYIFTDTNVDGLTEFEIPSVHNGKSVTAIGEFAFSSFSGESITVPKSIAEIPYGVFSNCNNLSRLTIPFVGSDRENQSHLGYLFGSDGIENNADYLPASLKTVEILSGITQIPDDAFRNCAKVTKIVLPETVESLGARSFYGCTMLEEVVLPTGLKTIKTGAFWACSSLADIEISASVEVIEPGAFNGINCKIIFMKKLDWSLYDGGTEVQKLEESFFAEENTSYIIVYNNRYTFKRKITDGA